jgi:hypothetical protein
MSNSLTRFHIIAYVLTSTLFVDLVKNEKYLQMKLEACDMHSIAVFHRPK